ncbi:MAG TPA: hypothetical protein VL633_03795 [Bacteroidota bacterium]|nr:hypothetical protein [Bacteroidota bacterium]
MKQNILSLLLVLLLQQLAFSQARFLKSYGLEAPLTSTLPPSNSISQINTLNGVVWIGTSKGVAKSVDGGANWESFRTNAAFVNDGIFALDVTPGLVWSATGYDKPVDGGTVQTGSGYTFSTDNGATWTHVGQTLDARGDSIVSYGINDSLWMLPVVVPEQNVTFDASIFGDTVWIASWASGLRKTTDHGQTWIRIPLPPDDRNTLKPTDTLWTYKPTDTLQQHRIFQRFDPRKNNNFLAFSVLVLNDSTIWCGTAGGVNKSVDGGKSWTKFSHQNQIAGILGNWVIAIKEQASISRLWTTNWKASDPQEQYGVSYTDDGGISWSNLLHGIKAYDLAFKDSVAYIATDDGVYRTSDGGLSFSIASSFSDPSTRQSISSSQVFSVDVIGDTVLVGTGDGLVTTIDNSTNQFGSSWKIYRSYQKVGTTGTSYAYPNPFAPNQGVSRIHYFATGQSTTSVNIDIFDFGMNRVRTVVHNAERASNAEYDEQWDGRDDDGKIVANGVYFYRIKLDGGELFGKILVLQ